MIGKLLDHRYQVIRVLATGGFGQTYIAKDTKRPGNPICVVKHLKPASTDPKVFDTAKRLFQSEAESLEKLGNHDQIPRLLAYFDENKEFFLVQEFIEGHTLSEELISSDQWSQSQVIELLQEVLSILEFVHQQGVIHRDIKPDNIIRRESDNKLVLVDFGAVKQLRATPGYSKLAPLVTVGAQLTATVAIGTPGYMPTEQGQGKPRPNSDIYALGIIAIVALTGVGPMDLQEDHNTGEIIWQHLVSVSPELATVLNKMVRYHFKDRYLNATEALEALQSVSRSATTKQYPITPYYQPPKPVSASRQKTLAVAPIYPIPQKPIETNANVRRGGKLDLLQLLIVIGLGAGAAAVAPIAVQNVQNLVNNLDNGSSNTAYSQLCLAKVAANSNLRSEPTPVYSDDIVQTVAYDTNFEVTGKRTQNNWVQVKLKNGKSAWVNSDVIQNNDQWVSCLRDKDIAITVVDEKNLIAERPAPKVQSKPAVSSADNSSPQASPSISPTPNEQESKVLEQAKKKYESGDLNGAIALLKSIPSGIEQTTKMIAQWQQEWSDAQNSFNDINNAINHGQWDKVLAYKDKLPNISPYWRDKIQPLLQQAAENLAKQQLLSITNANEANKPKQPQNIKKTQLKHTTENPNKKISDHL